MGHQLADSVPHLPKATPRQVAVDETAVEINGEWSWLTTPVSVSSTQPGNNELQAAANTYLTDHGTSLLHTD